MLSRWFRRVRHTSLYINSTIHALALSVVGWYKLCGRLLSDEKEHGEHADDDSGGGVVESKRDVFDESDESDGEGKTSAAAESTSAPVSLWARIRHHVTCRNLLAFSLGCTCRTRMPPVGRDSWCRA
jgi:hypothetical protein